MKRTFYQQALAVPHIAAIMDAPSLGRLPLLANTCSDLGIEALTVCTLPADLRLAGHGEAAAMLDALVEAVTGLDDVSVSLVGRRYYLPARLTEAGAATTPRRARLHLRIALDYACRASILSNGIQLPAATLLLLPEGIEPGNLLRWHYAQARKVRVDWPSFDTESLASLLAPCTDAASLPPRLYAAR